MVSKIHKLIGKRFWQVGHVICGASEQDGGDLARCPADCQNTPGQDPGQRLRQNNLNDGFQLGCAQRQTRLAEANWDCFSDSSVATMTTGKVMTAS